MRNFDFSSWQGVLSTLLGLAVITLLGVGIRLLVMQTVQQRRERENRQINERLRTLIAAYKTLGGSFTGDLAVDPTHLRDLQPAPGSEFPAPAQTSSDRSRRIRDAGEAALSDIILLGTEEQVRLAAQAANELVAGRPVHTAELVVSLRNFIRTVLDLDPNLIHYNELVLTGSQNATVAQYEKALKLLPKLTDLRQVVTHSFTVEDAPKAYESRLATTGLKTEVVYPDVV